MSSPIDVVLNQEGWDFGRPPPGTRLTQKLVGKIIGAARRLEVDREEEQREWDRRFREEASARAQAEQEKNALQREVFELRRKLEQQELRERMHKIQLGNKDQRFLLTGGGADQEVDAA